MGEVRILNEVLIECVYVLNKVYKLDRPELTTVLSTLLISYNVKSNTDLLLKSLILYKSTNLDIVDCLLIAYNQLYDYKIVSFDKKLNSNLI